MFYLQNFRLKTSGLIKGDTILIEIKYKKFKFIYYDSFFGNYTGMIKTKNENKIKYATDIRGLLCNRTKMILTEKRMNW